MPEAIIPAASFCVTDEWACLREVIVGSPFYRLPRPFPEELRAGVSEELWRKLKAREGLTMATAMPKEYARCAAQMDAAARLLQDNGVRVHRVPEFAPGEEGGLAGEDAEAIQFFPRDPLLVVGELVVELCLGNRRRRSERGPLRRLLAERGGLGAANVRSMDLPPPGAGADDAWPCLEGGDCLILADEVLVGVRDGGSNLAGANWLRRTLGESRRVTPVPLSADFAHLDLALGLVRPGLGIVCREALPAGLPLSLQAWQWVEISRDEALLTMAANVMPLDARRLLLPERASRVAQELVARGCEVSLIPFETVTAFNGGLRCWSHPLARWD